MRHRPMPSNHKLDAHVYGVCGRGCRDAGASDRYTVPNHPSRLKQQNIAKQRDVYKSTYRRVIQANRVRLSRHRDGLHAGPQPPRCSKISTFWVEMNDNKARISYANGCCGCCSNVRSDYRCFGSYCANVEEFSVAPRWRRSNRARSARRIEAWFHADS